MSLPGLGLAEPEEAQTVEGVEHVLAKECEWRFEIAPKKYVQIQLLSGTAEIFGTELVHSQIYTFTSTKAALFTWHGCTFEVSGDVLQSEYTAEETPMNDYINVHFSLQESREAARLQSREGPRVLLLGPDDAGKTSLAKMLMAYAIREDRQPVIVNLDTREGVLSLPGTMTATVFRSQIDVEQGWASAPMSGPSAIPVKLPLVYYYGLPNPEDQRGKLYKTIVSKVALAVTGRLQSDPDVRSTGIIIDTPGSLTSKKSATGIMDYDIISHIVSELSVNAIICLGSERLYSDIVKRFDNKPCSNNTSDTVSVVKLAKSGGCVDRDEYFMKSVRASQIREYFYGTGPKLSLSGGITLSPRQQNVEFASLALYRLLGPHSDAAYATNADSFEFDEFAPGDSYTATSAAMSSSVPLPASQVIERMAQAIGGLRNNVLAIMNAGPEADHDDIVSSSVVGFLYVIDVDMARGRISLLAPVAGRIPVRALLWGGWPEEVLDLGMG